jgi:hypothetical protein
MMRAQDTHDAPEARPVNDDPVVAQLDAYNRRDLSDFLACFHDDIRVLDADGQQLMVGKVAMHERYRRRFDECPELHCVIEHRVRLGSRVVDVERITGMGPETVQAVAIYTVNDGLITAVQFVTA